MKIREGSVFAIPLENGRFAIGIVTRVKPGRGKKCFVGYFFDKIFDALPSIEALETSQPRDAILVAICGDLGIHNGCWTVIGDLTPWKRDAWRVPGFARKDVVSGCYTKVVYADDDPSKIVSEAPTNEDEASNFPRDGVWGARAVEAYLSKILHTETPKVS